MKDSKPFFYRIVAADFLVEVVKIPDGQHKEWVYQLALDLVAGEGSTTYAKKVIAEVQDYRKQQAENADKRWKDKKKREKRVALRAMSEPNGSHMGRNGNNRSSSSNNSSTETEAVTEAESKDIEPLSGKPDGTNGKYPFQYILDTMNGILNTNYRNTDTFKKLVRARINEGLSPEDFETVCKKKFTEWGSDLKMMQYLRPKTLFGPNMNDYLGSLTAGRPVSERERINFAAGQAFVNGEDDLWSNPTR